LEITTARVEAELLEIPHLLHRLRATMVVQIVHQVLTNAAVAVAQVQLVETGLVQQEEMAALERHQAFLVLQ
jgi:hypothetical protein